MERVHQHIPAISWSAKARRAVEAPISFLVTAAIANPDLINLAAGLVDDTTLPADAVDRIVHGIMADPARATAALQYGTTLGLANLRRQLLGHIEALEGKPASTMGLSADHIAVTTGSQQSLYLLGEALLDPGDIVIAANPSYFVFTGALAGLGARILTVTMDDDGMDVEAVDRLLSRLAGTGELARVKLIYCTSYFQNPTGLTLSAARRPRLLEIVRKHSAHHRILILEDAAYRELRYDGPALPSIKSFDPDNAFTLLAQTFSKPFAPGLKLGYTAAPPEVVDAIVHQKGSHDFGSANLCQFIALTALQDGAYHAQVKRLQSHYRLKRDTLLGALDKHVPTDPAIRWTHPHGGLYVWMELPDAIDTARGSPFFDDAIAEGVLYVPGAYCHPPDENGHVPASHLRLSFGQAPLARLEPGVHRLAAVIRRHLGTIAP